MNAAKYYLRKMKAILAKVPAKQNGISDLKKELLLQALSLKNAPQKVALRQCIDLAKTLLKLICALEAVKDGN